jgi:tetratricopeptide (TPR) repeat protein
MPQAASSPKIEELRFRLKSDPKSRLFFPLAEELRKVGQLAEAEQVLRSGLTVHPTYLSAWVSLGRVLREQKNDGEAVEALNKALQLDPGNVVAARLLGDAYLALGDKVEAIKKYKLVRALLGTDDELDAVIEQLDRELAPPAEEPLAERTLPPFAESEPEENLYASADHEADSPFAPMPEAAEEPLLAAPAAAANPFEEAGASLLEEEVREERATGDDQPMLANHEESPFEEAPAGYGSAAFAVESVPGMSVEEAPLVAEVPAPVAAAPHDESDVFAPSAEPFPESGSVPAATEEELTQTLTMAELYARQGLIDEARDIYEHILERDPNNDAVRSRLEALMSPESSAPLAAASAPEAAQAAPLTAPSSPPSSMTDGGGKVERLQQWLSRVSRREVGHV